MGNQPPDKMSVEIDHSKRRVLFKQWGLLNKENIIQSYHVIYGTEGFDPSYDVIADYHGLTEIDLNLRHIKEILATVKDLEIRTGKGAIVVGANTGRYMMGVLFSDVSRMFSSATIRWKAFRSTDEAEAWLDSAS